MGRDVHNNQLPLTIFVAIIALNIGIATNYLAAYRTYRRSNSTVFF